VTKFLKSIETVLINRDKVDELAGIGQGCIICGEKNR